VRREKCPKGENRSSKKTAGKDIKMVLEGRELVSIIGTNCDRGVFQCDQSEDLQVSARKDGDRQEKRV